MALATETVIGGVQGPSEGLVLSLGEASPDDLAALNAGLLREREWYADAPRFATDDDIVRAIARNDLVLVKDTDDLRKISRFSSGVEGFTPYVTPRALRMVTDFTGLWRTILWEQQIQAPVDMLAATSMVRAETYQAKLMANGHRLASPDSTHCTGNAVDFDISGYYRLGADGEIWTHTHPGRRLGQAAVSAQLKERYGDRAGMPRRAEWFDPTITDAAIEAARRMHADGSVNFIEEFAGTSNACIHLAVNPEY